MVVLFIANVICYAAHEQSVIRTRLAKTVPNICFISNRFEPRRNWTMGGLAQGLTALMCFAPASAMRILCCTKGLVVRNDEQL